MESRATYKFPFSRYPAVRIVLLMIAGILAAHHYSLSLPSIVLLFFIAAVCYFFFDWQAKSQSHLLFPRTATLLFFLLIAAFGALRFTYDAGKEPPNLIKLLQVSPWEEIKIEGSIQSISTTSSGKERWDVNVHKSELFGIESSEKFKTRVLIDGQNAATLGDFVSFDGTIIPISDKRNPLDFNYKAYLKSQGIEAQIRLDEIDNITANEEIFSFIWWREKALALVEKNFAGETAPIAKALLLGYKQDLDSESKTAFARAGLSHIMAVSGLHVGFIVAPFWFLIPYFWTKKYGSFIGLFVLLLILFLYAGITGFSASVLRASVMAGFLTFGKLFYKVKDSINLTASAAIVLLIFNPAQLFEIGFQLSFSAVLIILMILPAIQNALPYWVRVRWYAAPIMAVIVSLVVQFGLYPLQVFYFGEISLVSPIANALFVPLLALVVPLSLIALIITAIFPVAGFILNIPSLYFLKWMAAFVTQAAEWSWAWKTASLSSSLFFLLWLFLIFIIAAFRIPALRWKMLLGFLMIGCMMNTQQLMQKFNPQKLQITFFDVGQGDAALLKTPSNKHVLIDAGVWSPGYNSGKSVIIPHLKDSGIEKLDAVILSHPHADHIGGIVDLIHEVEIDVIYNSGFNYSSNLFQNYRYLANQKGIPIQQVKAGDILPIDSAMLFLVMGPDGEIYNSDPNEHSVVLNVRYGESEFLFTGDAGEDQEERLVHAYGDLLDTDLLKVGHHGSKTSSGKTFLQQVTPELSIVSLAEGNKFRHPHREALQRLHQTKTELLFTSRERAVQIESDGINIRRKLWY